MGKKEKAYELLSDLLHRSHYEYIKADIIARFYAVMRKHDKALLWVAKMKELKEMAFMGMHQHPWFRAGVHRLAKSTPGLVFPGLDSGTLQG